MSADVLGDDVQPIKPALTIENTAVPTKIKLSHCEQPCHRQTFFDRGKLRWSGDFLSASELQKHINLAEGAGEKAQQLKVFASLPEDLGSIPSTHIWVLKLPITVGPRI